MNLLRNRVFSVTNFIDGTSSSRTFLCNLNMNNEKNKKKKIDKKSNSGIKKLLKKLY